MLQNDLWRENLYASNSTPSTLKSITMSKSKSIMEKSHHEIYLEFLEKEIIVGEEVLEIHSRHSDRTLIEDIMIINSCIRKEDGLVIIKTRDDATGLSYFMLSRMGRLLEDCWTDLQTGNTKWSECEKSMNSPLLISGTSPTQSIIDVWD